MNDCGSSKAASICVPVPVMPAVAAATALVRRRWRSRMGAAVVAALGLGEDVRRCVSPGISNLDRVWISEQIGIYQVFKRVDFRD